jgi:hypothetical protein
MSGKPAKLPATKNRPAAVGFVTQALLIQKERFLKYLNFFRHCYTICTHPLIKETHGPQRSHESHWSIIKDFPYNMNMTHFYDPNFHNLIVHNVWSFPINLKFSSSLVLEKIFTYIFYINTCRIDLSYRCPSWRSTPSHFDFRIFDSALCPEAFMWLWTFLTMWYLKRFSYIYTWKWFLIFQSQSRPCATVVRADVERSVDPCVPSSNPTEGRGCWSFGWDHINHVGVARKRTLASKSHEC